MGGCASKPKNVDGEVPESDASALTVASPTSVDTTPEIVNAAETLNEDKKEEEEVKAKVSKDEEEVKVAVSNEKEPEIIEVEAEEDASSKKEGEPKDEKKGEEVKIEEKSTATY